MAKILAVVTAASAVAVLPPWHRVFDSNQLNLAPVFDAMFVEGGPSATGSREVLGGRPIATCTGLEHLGPWPLGLLLVAAALAFFAARASSGRTARLSATAACAVALAAAFAAFNSHFLSHLFFDVNALGLTEPLFWSLQALMVPTALALGVCTFLEWRSARG
ncbi:hypothetical protein [Nannocystis radixulma]|uniref:Uncharacterized protein n=1 Tax=Nannocystis radixulma TaxID=2995305 RepID=A0ABT5BFW5_9BACT|nr:hypothetical protein [Nannocystis radixulma]MDC0672323.1 hypothetical protein [Nannocystis radixulma]